MIKKSSYKQATDFEGLRNNDRSKLGMKGRSIERTRNKINEQCPIHLKPKTSS